MEYQTGDLFATPCHALAHCVSADFAMGRGIAVHFKERYGRVGELRAQGKEVGSVAYLYDEPTARHVFYLVTKGRYFDRPTLASLRASVEALVAACNTYGVTELAMPRIGCGLDRLNWPDVESVLQSAFAGSGVRVVVYSL
jgi:O-acetyl-ADP-ribose deacetylase (regulator of RNase III)